MKCIVISQDNACRINPINGETIEAFRPSVVTITEFVTGLVMKRALQPVGGPLSDLATDAEFLKYYTDSDKDAELAVSSFMSKFHVDNTAEISEDFMKAADAQHEALAREEEQARIQKSNVEEAARQQAILDNEQARIASEQKAAAEATAKEAAASAEKAAASAEKAAAKTGAK